MFYPSDEDYELIFQNKLEIIVKIEVLKYDMTILDELVGVVTQGSLNISSDSYTRRTFSVELIPINNQGINVSENSLIWIDKKIKLYVGIKNQKNGEYKWYNQGCFIYQNTSGNFDAATNNLTINCSDYYTLLDGTVNGEMYGANTIKIPAYTVDENDMSIKTYNIIKDVVIATLKDAGIDEYIVDDIGEYKAMPRYNSDYEKYREEHPSWNYIPSDIELSAGSSYGQLLQELIELYPNNDGAFDENGVFVAQMIPSKYEDIVVMNDKQIKNILISESLTCDMTKVRNICEVWGKVFSPKYYSTDNCTYTNNVYHATINHFSIDDENENSNKYSLDEEVAIKIPENCLDNAKLDVNGFGELSIYTDGDNKIKANDLIKDNTYVFTTKTAIVNNVKEYRFYLQGQYQVHALDVLTDGTVLDDNWTDSDGNAHSVYSEGYFKAKYNCNAVNLTVVENSPFTVQKIGERVSVKSGDTFEKIYSDTIALENAVYQNWCNCRLTDNITLTTTLVPWISENMKISYIKSNSNEEVQYIVTSVSHDYGSCQTTITAYTFYELYNE